MAQTYTRPPISKNPLGTEKIGKPLFRFSVPAVTSLVVNAIYNIVDQIFIGHDIGMVGIAATNVAFPLTTICISVNLLLGVGAASNFSLKLGAGDGEAASHVAGNVLSLASIFGVAMCAITLLFLNPMLNLFGATADVLPYAQSYTAIICLGIPFLVVTMVCMHMIRADGSPNYAMICILSSAIFNVIFDPIFLFVFKMGIAGIAWATTLGQVLSAVLGILYMVKRFKSVPLKKEHLRLQGKYVKMICSLGAAACFNQLAMTVVQVVMNNVLRHYGAMSVYGSVIPLACVGAITKVNVVFMSVNIGIAQGNQPIVGFNYGAKQYQRVKDSLFRALIAATISSIIFFLIFQLFPETVMSIFGENDPLYLEFAVRYLRTYMLMTFLNGVQPVCSNFLTSIGKAPLGILVSMTRQIIFLLPLIAILPIYYGVTGVMYAGPIADAAAFLVSGIIVIT
ncbi:MAG: MATE family efflux transporter, partial [Oscillospiraceae bacterium]